MQPVWKDGMNCPLCKRTMNRMRTMDDIPSYYCPTEKCHIVEVFVYADGTRVHTSVAALDYRVRGWLLAFNKERVLA